MEHSKIMTQVLESLDWHDTGEEKAYLDVIFPCHYGG